MKTFIRIIFVMLMAFLGMQTVPALAAQSDIGKPTLSYWHGGYYHGYGYRGYGYHRYYYPRAVYYRYGCRWIPAHYTRAGFFIPGHRAC